MEIQSEKLIAELVTITEQNRHFAETLRTKADRELNWRSTATSWSMLECLEHLNLYGDFYIPELERVIARSKSRPDAIFRSGILGNFFAESMLPKEKSKKMKTFKDKNPLNSKLDRNTIDRFITQQSALLQLLEKARYVSLNSEKTRITLTSWLKLKLGDTFRFVIFHNLRHKAQMERIALQMAQP